MCSPQVAYLFSKSLGVASWGFVTFSLKSAGRCGDGVPGEPPAGELVWKAGEKAGAGPGAEARAADGLTPPTPARTTGPAMSLYRGNAAPEEDPQLS